MKLFLINLVEKLHLRLFGHPMGKQMRDFLGNISWSVYSGLIAMPLTMIVQTLAGRFMGPTEFGKYSLVLLISSYLLIFTFFGLDIASVKSIVKAKTADQKAKAFMSPFVFVMVTLLIISLIGLVFSNQISSAFNISREIIIFALLYSIIASLKAITDSLVRGLEQFKRQAIGKILEAVVLAIVFVLIFFLQKKMNFNSYIISIFTAAAVLVIYYFVNLKSYFKGFSFAELKAQLAQGRLFMLCAFLGTIYFSSDRLLIAKFIDLKSLGIYSAYYSGSFALTGAISLLFTNVLLPATAKLDDKGFTKKMDQLMVGGFIPVFTCICVIIYIFLSIFGSAYPLRADYLLLFALVSTVYFFSNMLNTIILDSDTKNYFKYVIISNSVNLLTVAYYYILMRYISRSIDWILVGFAANLVINLFVQRVFIKKMRVNKNV